MNDKANLKTKIWKHLKDLDYYLAVVCMLFVTVFCMTTVISRYMFGKTWAALDELNMIIFIWFLYASITYCVRLDKHIRIEVFEVYLSERKNLAMKIVADSIWLIFSVYLTYTAFRLVQFNLKYVARTPMLDIPMYLVYFILLLSFVAMSVALVNNIMKRVKSFREAKVSYGNGVER